MANAPYDGCWCTIRTSKDEGKVANIVSGTTQPSPVSFNSMLLTWNQTVLAWQYMGCSGMLISLCHLLTAAHCVPNCTNNMNGIYANAYRPFANNSSSTTQQWSNNNPKNGGYPFLFSCIKSYTVHPQYNCYGLSENDVAIAMLQTLLNMTVYASISLADVLFLMSLSLSTLAWVSEGQSRCWCTIQMPIHHTTPMHHTWRCTDRCTTPCIRRTPMKDTTDTNAPYNSMLFSKVWSDSSTGEGELLQLSPRDAAASYASLSPKFAGKIQQTNVDSLRVSASDEYNSDMRTNPKQHAIFSPFIGCFVIDISHKECIDSGVGKVKRKYRLRVVFICGFLYTLAT